MKYQIKLTYTLDKNPFLYTYIKIVKERDALAAVEKVDLELQFESLVIGEIFIQSIKADNI